MASILPALVDKWRTNRDGQRRYVGQILLIDGADKKRPKRVIAEVYGATLEEMRERKRLVYEALKGGAT
jgi:hypothetical protein